MCKTQTDVTKFSGMAMAAAMSVPGALTDPKLDQNIQNSNPWNDDIVYTSQVSSWANGWVHSWVNTAGILD